MMDNKGIYYCDLCALKLYLPLTIGKISAGYCRLCGYSSVFFGHLSKEELEERGVTVPELGDL